MVYSLSNNLKLVLEAHKKGYRVIDGEVISPFSGKALLQNIRSAYGRINYKLAHFTCGKKKVKAHLLAAYQKFGEDLFDPNVVVRHLDGNSLNNRDSNLALGTRSVNSFDRPAKERLNYSVKAATALRKFTDQEMEEIRKFHSGSYKETMETFNITSKATLHRILNVKYKTKV